VKIIKKIGLIRIFFEFHASIGHMKDLKGPQPDQFFAHRVMVTYHNRKKEGQIKFWRFFSGFSLTTSLLLSFYFYNFTKNKIDFTQAPINKSMVLQISEIPADSRITYISLEIDDDMQFVTDSLGLKNSKEVTLAITDLNQQELRLPFVFKAIRAGRKNIKIKFLDSDFKVVATEEQHLEFTEKTNPTERNI